MKIIKDRIKSGYTICTNNNTVAGEMDLKLYKLAYSNEVIEE